ncbi:MAG: phosphatidylglycerophosphatase A [Limisphaerales bacterium]
MSTGDKLIVWIAKGFGSGCVPKGPGTVGSVVGIGWFALLLLCPNFLWYSVGTVAGIPLSIWICGRAEKILNLTDPGSIVLDEIIALPICFLPLVMKHAPGLPSVAQVFSEQWLVVIGVFAGFRLFDIWKPWPIRQLQDLHGGLGVTIDDVLAGVYVAIILFFIV